MPPPSKLQDPPDPYTELIAWRLLGAVVWQGAVFALSAAAWHAASTTPLAPLSAAWRLLWSPSDLARLAALWATSVAVLAAQQRLLSPADVEPLHWPAVGVPAGGLASRVLGRCLIRAGGGGPAAAVALYAASALSGAVGVASLAAAAGAKHGAARWLWGYGAFLGVAYAGAYLARAGNVLAHPTIQRPRYFRVKGRIASAARAALALASVTAVAAWLAPLFALPLLSRSGRAPTGCPVAAPGALFAAWRAAALCAFAWAAGANVLGVIFTERIAFAGDAANGGLRPLLAALQHKDPVVRSWALADLVSVAEGSPGRSGALAAVFGDETGLGGWVPLARYCLAELEDLAAAVAGATAVPAAAAAAAAQTGGGGGGIKWNSLKQVLAGGGSGGKAGGGGKAAAAAAAARAAALADWHVRGRYGQSSACLRALAGLAAASLERDRFGVAQLSAPSLGDATAGLLAACAVLRQYAARLAEAQTAPQRRRRSRLPSPVAALFAAATGASSSGGVSDDPAAAASALLDVATTAAYRVTGAFGPVIRAPAREAAAAAAKRGAAGAAGAGELLEGLLAYEE